MILEDVVFGEGKSERIRERDESCLRDELLVSPRVSIPSIVSRGYASSGGRT